jgi:hypothetical protein
MGKGRGGGRKGKGKGKVGCAGGVGGDLSGTWGCMMHVRRIALDVFSCVRCQLTAGLTCNCWKQRHITVEQASEVGQRYIGWKQVHDTCERRRKFNLNIDIN